MKKLLLFLTLALFVSFQAIAANLTAKVNRNPVPFGETFILTVEYDGDPQNRQPDFSPLSKDFSVYSVDRVNKSYFTNGKSGQIYQWNLAMLANKEGKVIIPALGLGNDTSKPIDLLVGKQGSSSQNITPNFSISRSINNSKPLVQQQINYNLTIKTTKALQGNEPQFLDNGKNDWIIRNLGQPKISSKLENGVEVKTIDFTYALFPQKSGELRIPEVRFEGFYVDENKQGRDQMQGLFGNFGSIGFGGFDSMLIQQTPVILTAKPISINVGKIPAENNGNWWLPAKKLAIVSDWQKKLPEFRVGEAVNREIYLQAVGVVDSQMPKLNFAEIDGIKQYPEKPSYQGEVKGDNIIALLKQVNVYIPEKAGNMTIPPVVVNWYNVVSNKMEKAELPALEINVAAGALSTPKKEAVPSIQARAENVEVLAEDTAELLIASSPKNIYIYIFLAFIGGIMVSYLLLKPKKVKIKAVEEKELSLSQALKSNDLKLIRDSVLVWAKKQYGSQNIANLNDVAAQVKNSEFAEQLNALNQALYSPDQHLFDINHFYRLFSMVEKKQKKQKNQNPLLPDLYQ